MLKIFAFPVTALAWCSILCHLAGLAFAAVGMSPGTPLAPLPERLNYLAGSPLGWTLGWCCWMLCAILLIAFLVAVTRRLETNADLARLGLVIAIAGAAFDLFCDSVFICVLPMIASWRPVPEPLFLAVERITSIGSLAIANGAYSVAILLINVALREKTGPRPLTIWIGYGVCAAGLVLAAAGFTGSAQHAQWATLPTIGLFCVWQLLVARSLEPSGSRP